ncbi:MAG: hypothetical protein Q7W29_02335 [bacterium]|jgi:hypothetical protein|nr:hypothetical protein [bacterium]
MTIRTLKTRLAKGLSVHLGTAEWEPLLDTVHVEESHVTGAGGLLRLIRIGELWAVVESYDLGSQDIRAFDDRATATAYLQKCLLPYQHYWLGYG